MGHKPSKPSDPRRLKRDLAEAIRSARHRAKLSQDEAAWRSGVHRAYMGAIEQAKPNITVKKLVQVCNGIGVKASSLLAEIGL